MAPASCRMRTHTIVMRRISPRRQGTALIIAIVCLGLISAMAVSLVQITTLRRSQTEWEQWRLQSVWLAESALARGLTRLAEDESYTGEDWQVDDVDVQHHAGLARIAVTTRDGEQEIVVTADFPRDHTNRVRTMRTWTIAGMTE